MEHDLDNLDESELLALSDRRRRAALRAREMTTLRGYALDKAAEARVDAKRAAAEARRPDTRTIEQIEHDTEQWLADVEASDGGKLRLDERQGR